MFSVVSIETSVASPDSSTGPSCGKPQKNFQGLVKDQLPSHAVCLISSGLCDVSDVPVKPSAVLSPSPAPSAVTKAAAGHPDTPSPPRNHVTVAKKQLWVRQCSPGLHTNLPLSSSLRAPDQSAASQEASGQAWSQRLQQDKVEGGPGRAGTDSSVATSSFLFITICPFWFQTEQRGDGPCISLNCDTSSVPCLPVGSPAPQPSACFPDSPVSASSSSSRSAQHAYLQSLERSSRAWVLSSGKTQASYETIGRREERATNIWYNPIPEEEDAAGLQRDDHAGDQAGEGGAARRAGPREIRAELGGARVRTEQGFNTDCPPEATNPSVCHQTDDITAESAGEVHAWSPL